MSKQGIELLSKMLSNKLAVVDLIEAPEKFTDEEIGIIKQYHPTDIDYDTKGLPQEAFWSIIHDKVTGYGCNIRFGKRYVNNDKKYAWYVFVQGKNAQGKYECEELSQSQELPMNIEVGITLLKKYLDKYSLSESVNIDTSSNYKKDLADLYKIVVKVWNFIHETNQEFQFNEIRDQMISLERKYPEKSAQLKRIEKRIENIRSIKIRFEDSYYQLKSDIAGFLK